MHFRSFFIANVVAVLSFFSAPLLHADPQGTQNTSQTQPASSDPQKQSGTGNFCSDVVSTQKHTTHINGVQISYTSHAGYLKIKAPDEKTIGCFYYTAYIKDGAEDTSNRPITFAFNGGPGSSSVWLHLGALGPKKIDLGEEGLSRNDPFKMKENPYSLLDISDLVFIDPIATGYSKSDSKDDNQKFFGVKNDYISVANFIQKFLSVYNRWSSPKYIAGESYGGIRGAMVTYYLQDSLGINVQGLILVSPFLSTVTISMGDPNQDQPYVNFLPSFSAAAWYHHKLSPRLQAMSVADVVKEAEDFANGPYLEALQKGTRISVTEYNAIVAKLSELTSIPPDRVDELNIKISDAVFFDELLRREPKKEDRKRIGRFDSRFTGGIADKNSPDTMGKDPSQAALQPQFTNAMNHYLINELGIRSDDAYQILSGISNWPFDSDASEYSVMGKLNQAIDDNPGLKIYVASGYYDLAVPYEATQYNFSHMPENCAALLSHVQFGTFESGHMIYIKESELKKFRSDMEGFYGATKSSS